MLVRRADGIEVIGTALFDHAAGTGHARVAARLGRPQATVRHWLSRFRERTDSIAIEVTRLGYRLDPSFALPRLVWWPQHRMTAAQHALVVLNAVADSVTRCYRPAACPWHLLSALTGARLLAPG